MNFLAHLYFSPPAGPAMIGSLMPDLVRGRLPDDLPAEVKQAIATHRRIDRLTDAHPQFQASCRRFLPACRRLAGIVTDVIYDHFLSVHWAAFHNQPRTAFIEEAYVHLGRSRHLAPEPMAAALGRMQEQDWLGAYVNDTGLRRIFGMMNHRLSVRLDRTIDIDGALDTLEQDRSALDREFLAFFTDLEHRLPSSATSTAHH
ncbi:MAG: ACP phosphodiesterase [Phycisphaeraceae bacterium]|nr:ACP phosphodiesterase [Phycisphaeraceae bacterium]